LLTSFPIFPTFGAAVRKSTLKRSSVIKSYLLNFVIENACSQLYVDAIIAIFFPKSLNIPYLELHNSLKEKEN
jgi:hypothetical protein